MNSISLLYFTINYAVIMILGSCMWLKLHRYLRTTTENGIRSAQNVTELDRQITRNLIVKVRFKTNCFWIKIKTKLMRISLWLSNDCLCLCLRGNNLCAWWAFCEWFFWVVSYHFLKNGYQKNLAIFPKFFPFSWRHSRVPKCVTNCKLKVCNVNLIVSRINSGRR